ncbi:hypothetical protein EYF80_032050 [Liparis tanakae]|uniref:Uncharacterized protein n=1 Tax=Liparis tanakae TaxID=230148 RepID=A0A4Z2GYP0_9TELE|nr:hypothetical protein EYF80_032050 [Liparis tanakae]
MVYFQSASYFDEEGQSILFEGKEAEGVVLAALEAAQTGLDGVQRLGKDDKLGHVWNTYDLSVQLRAKANRLLDLSAVYQPEPRNTPDIFSQITHIKNVLSFFVTDTSETQEELTSPTRLW